MFSKVRNSLIVLVLFQFGCVDNLNVLNEEIDIRIKNQTELDHTVQIFGRVNTGDTITAMLDSQEMLEFSWVKDIGGEGGIIIRTNQDTLSACYFLGDILDIKILSDTLEIYCGEF